MLENKVKNSNIPYTQITKEVWLSLVKTLENEQIGEIITAMYEYIYEGKEPYFNSKVMNGQWDMLTENIERMSKGYFNKVDNAKASAKKRIENKKNISNSNMENNHISESQAYEDDVCYQEVETAENGLKIPNTDVLKTMTSTEFDIPSIPATAEVRSLPKKDNNINITEEENKEMGNVTNIQLNPATGKFEYTKEQKEEIKNKIVNNSIPRPINNTTITTSTPSNKLTFEEILKAESYNIKTIISDFNSGGLRQTKQGPENLKELLNRNRFYRNELIEYISRYVNVDILAA
jgi:hypothetical protein